MTFFSFLLCGGFHRGCVVSANLFMLGVLSILFYKNVRKRKSIPLLASSIRDGYIYFLVPAFLFLAIYFIAKDNPYGSWDAWALWNMKSRFLLLSGPSWDSVVRDLHWHTQPDYPLLLPFVNVWGWTIAQKSLLEIPLWTSVIYTLSCAGLLYGGLARYIHTKVAFWVSLFLLSLPTYSLMGTSQYADIVLAYYLLAALISLAMALREKDKGCALLSGLFLGLGAFTKNEGVITCGLLTILTIGYLLFEKQKDLKVNGKLIFFLAIGLILTAPGIMIFKLFLTPPSRDILFKNIWHLSQFLNLEKCSIIFQAFLYEILHTRWGPLWLVILLTIAMGFGNFVKKEIKILVLFLLLYTIALFLVYITTINFDLNWRLSRTLPRILFYLLPSLLFVIFYAYGDKRNSAK